MIKLPPGFDAALLFDEFFLIGAAFVSTGLIISAGFLIMNVLKRI
jgi:hypothetical protein